MLFRRVRIALSWINIYGKRVHELCSASCLKLSHSPYHSSILSEKFQTHWICLRVVSRSFRIQQQQQDQHQHQHYHHDHHHQKQNRNNNEVRKNCAARKREPYRIKVSHLICHTITIPPQCTEAYARVCDRTWCGPMRHHFRKVQHGLGPGLGITSRIKLKRLYGCRLYNNQCSPQQYRSPKFVHPW